jgi:hypothetical protein
MESRNLCIIGLERSSLLGQFILGRVLLWAEFDPSSWAIHRLNRPTSVTTHSIFSARGERTASQTRADLLFPPQIHHCLQALTPSMAATAAAAAAAVSDANVNYEEYILVAKRRAMEA